MSVRQSYKCVVCLQRDASVSTYKLHLRNSVTKQRGDRPPTRPPGTLLDAVHITGCLKFLTLEELVFMVFFQKLVLSPD